MGGNTTQVKWNPYSPNYFENPYPHLKECRETNPIQYDNYGNVMLFRHKDVALLLEDPRFDSSDLSAYLAEKEPYIFKNSGQCPYLSQTTKKWLMYLTGHEHRQNRIALGKAIFEVDYDDFIHSALNDTIARFEHEATFDLVELSTFFIHHILRSFIGLDDSVTMEEIAEYSNQLSRMLDMFVTKQQYLTMNEYCLWGKRVFKEEGFKGKLRKHVAHLNLSEDEIYSLLTITLMAFFETSKDNLPMSILALMNQPELIEPMIQADTALAKQMADEFVRLNSPLQFTIRSNKEAVVLDGVEYPANTKFVLGLASANRDETVFETPDQLRLDRVKNPHLGFASGSHICLGAVVARKELEYAMPALARLIKNYKLDESRPLVYSRQIFMNMLHHAYVIRK